MPITPEKLEKFFRIKLAAEIGPVGLKQAIDAKERFTLVDVRKAEAFKAGHIPGAVSLPLAVLEKSTKKISKRLQVYVYCADAVCRASTRAAYLLAKKGYLVAQVLGGYQEYAKRYPTTVKAPKAEKNAEPVEAPEQKPELVAA